MPALNKKPLILRIISPSIRSTGSPGSCKDPPSTSACIEACTSSGMLRETRTADPIKIRNGSGQLSQGFRSRKARSKTIAVAWAQTIISAFVFSSRTLAV